MSCVGSFRPEGGVHVALHRRAQRLRVPPRLVGHPPEERGAGPPPGTRARSSAFCERSRRWLGRRPAAADLVGLRLSSRPSARSTTSAAAPGDRPADTRRGLPGDPEGLGPGPGSRGHFRLRYDVTDSKGCPDPAARRPHAPPQGRCCPRPDGVSSRSSTSGRSPSSPLTPARSSRPTGSNPTGGYWRNQRRDPADGRGRCRTRLTPVSPMTRLMCRRCRDARHGEPEGLGRAGTTTRQGRVDAPPYPPQGRLAQVAIITIRSRERHDRGRRYVPADDSRRSNVAGTPSGGTRGRTRWTSLSAVDKDGGLPPDDLELLGTAAWWAGHPDEATEALERAFAGLRGCRPRRGRGAGRGCARLPGVPSPRWAIGGGWVAQVHRCSKASRTRRSAPTSASTKRSRPSWKDGSRRASSWPTGRWPWHGKLHNADALYQAMSFKGMGEVMAGRWQSGVALIDEAAAAASAGRLDLRAASDIYCNTIAACRNLGDLQRAAQWTEEAERWMRRRKRSEGTRGSARCIAPSSRCCTASGRKRSRRLAKRAPSSSDTGSWTRWGRAIPGGRHPVANGRPRRRRRGVRPGLRVRPRRDARPRAPVPGARRGGRRAARHRAGIDGRLGDGRLLRQGDARAPAAGSGRHRACGWRPRRRREGGRGTRIDRGPVRTSAVHRRRADGPWRAPPRGGQADGGLADPEPVVAIVADDRPAVRECAGAPAVRRGVGGRGRCGDSTAGPAGRPRRVRAAGRDARPSAGRCHARRGGWASGAAQSCGTDGDEDVHVHGHRHLHRPGRRHRRRGLERVSWVGTTASCARRSRSTEARW